MSPRYDRFLDRLWLTLSGSVSIAVTLQLGAQLGAHPWSIDAVLAAYAAAPAPPFRAAPPDRCRGDR